MEILKNNFNRIRRNNSFWSSLICFNETMKTAPFKKALVKKMFLKLVDKDDFRTIESKTLISQASKINSRKFDF